jgi:dolichol-phosphate mannosyltransferase
MASHENPGSSRPSISVVIPLYNEEENCRELLARLTEVMAGIGKPYELVFVDDGSTDRTAGIVREMGRSDPAVALVSLSRNFGQENAVCAGLSVAQGAEVVLMDGDLQDSPEIIPAMLARKREGYGVVYGVKSDRKESLLRRGLTNAYYHLMLFFAQVHMPLNAGLFSVMDARVAREIVGFTENNKHISGLRSYVGFRQTAFPYSRSERHAGQAKSLYQLFRMGLNAFFAFTIVPLRVIVFLGLLMASLGAAFSAYSLLAYLFSWSGAAGFDVWKLILVVQGTIVTLGVTFLAEYLGRVYIENKRRPDFFIDSITRGAGGEPKGEGHGEP